jgi:hypothetical protein
MAERLNVIRVALASIRREIEPDHRMIIRIAAEAAGELFPRHSFVHRVVARALPPHRLRPQFQPEEHRRGRMA